MTTRLRPNHSYSSTVGTLSIAQARYTSRTTRYVVIAIFASVAHFARHTCATQTLSADRITPTILDRAIFVAAADCNQVVLIVGMKQGAYICIRTCHSRSILCDTRHSVVRTRPVCIDTVRRRDDTDRPSSRSCCTRTPDTRLLCRHDTPAITQDTHLAYKWGDARTMHRSHCAPSYPSVQLHAPVSMLHC